MRMDALLVMTVQQASTMTIQSAMWVHVKIVLLVQTVSPMTQTTMTSQLVIYAREGSIVEHKTVWIALQARMDSVREWNCVRFVVMRQNQLTS